METDEPTPKIPKPEEALLIFADITTDEVVGKGIGYFVGQFALRSGKTPREAIQGLLDGGAFDETVDTPEARRRVSNHRKMYAGAGILLQPRRPQG